MLEIVWSLLKSTIDEKPNTFRHLFLQYTIRVKKQKLTIYNVVIFLPSFVLFHYFVSYPFHQSSLQHLYDTWTLLCHGLTFSGSLRTFDIITDPGCPVRKIGDLAEGVWSEIDCVARGMFCRGIKRNLVSRQFFQLGGLGRTRYRSAA